MSRPRSRALAAFAALVLALLGVQLASVAPAAACATYATDCGGSQAGGGSDGLQSSGTQQATYTSTSSPTTCQVYGNGTGMGSYCLGPGGIASKSLRERFGGQVLHRCRYSELPDVLPAPFNANPDEGRYLLQACLVYIDLDTTYGGSGRGMTMATVFVPWGTDTSTVHNGISDFLWNNMKHRSNQLPVPFLVAQPNPVPLVGIPTYFTFRWIDPATGTVRAMGPYADNPNGGPFLELTSNGVTMRAEATSIIVNPNQEDMEKVVCSPATPYREGVPADQQPPGACSITFPRSSASAERLTTVAMPRGAEDAYPATVSVKWRITYGEPGDMRQLGDVFVMRLRQMIPVQEVQAPNQPPTVIY